MAALTRVPEWYFEVQVPNRGECPECYRTRKLTKNGKCRPCNQRRPS